MYQNNNQKSKQIAAFWKSKQGSKSIATGKMELPDGRKLFLTLIVNQNKESAKHPDYVVLAKPDSGGQANSFGAQDPFGKSAQSAADPFNGAAEQGNTDDWF